MSIGDYQRERALAWECASVCDQVLKDDIGLVEGVREIVDLQRRLQSVVEGPLANLVGFKSATDVFPIGEARDSWSKDSLESLDRQRMAYESASRDTVIESCRQIAEGIRSVYGQGPIT